MKITDMNALVRLAEAMGYDVELQPGTQDYDIPNVVLQAVQAQVPAVSEKLVYAVQETATGQIVAITGDAEGPGSDSSRYFAMRLANAWNICRGSSDKWMRDYLAAPEGRAIEAMVTAAQQCLRERT